MVPNHTLGLPGPDVDIKQMKALSSEIDPNLSDNVAFADLRDYWLSKCDNSAVPTYADIDPLDLRSHLGSLFVAVLTEDGEDFRYRLIGTELTVIHGADYTGRTVTEAFSGRHPAFGASVVLAYEKCLRECQPLRAKGQVIWANKDHISFDSLHLPCASNGNTADIILGKLSFVRAGGVPAL